MTTGDPWSKFYWSDWRSDPRLRVCSLAARGLWIEMLALMHEGTPRGHLLVNSIAPTDAQLAVLAGAPPEQIPELLGELESAGVFSRTQKGAIYSRRMTKDDKKTQIARKNGKSGGNPSLGKNTTNRASDNPGVKGGVNTQKLEARSQKLEARDQKDCAPAAQPAKRFAFEGKVARLNGKDFDNWCQAYAGGDPDLLRSLMQQRDDWLTTEAPSGQRKNWFMSTSNWLAQKREERRRAEVASGGEWDGSGDPFIALQPYLEWVRGHGGRDPDRYRRLIETWIRDYGAGIVVGCFKACKKEGPADPLPWIDKVLQERHGHAVRGRREPQGNGDTRDRFQELRDAGLI